MDHVRWDERPRLRRPVLIAAFEGWTDAAEAATTAARYLRDRWGARPFASIDPEEFYDFTSTRPQVRLTAGLIRQIIWPSNEFFSAALTESRRDVILLIGSEPQLRWRAFCGAVMGVLRQFEVEFVVTLGALLADVAHTRPVRVTGSAASAELVERLGLRRSRYEGPTGITGVLHDALGQEGIPSASLFAAVPHYVAATPSPKAALELVRQAASLVEVPVVTSDLSQQAQDYERQVSEVVESDEDVSAYVTRLEEDADAEGLELTSGEELAAELQRYLRDQSQ